MPKPLPTSEQPQPKQYDVIILGAGSAGAFTAEAIAALEDLYGNKGKLKVLIIDAGEGIINKKSSSYNECYKLHTGVHYIGDEETAKQCLRDSIAFARKLPHFILGDQQDPWRRGRHYLVSNSMFSKEHTRKVCESLKQLYAELVKENPENKVFGEPEDFIKYLEPKDYPHIAEQIPVVNEKVEITATKDIETVTSQVTIDKITTIFGIETAESQIDIETVKEELQKQLKSRSNVTFLPNNYVAHVGFSENSLLYSVETWDKTKKTPCQFQAKAIVNCTWQNIEKIDKGIGLYSPDGRINRMKLSIRVALSPELKNINTGIFSVGPHCSITNLGDGTAIITFEPVTNIAHWSAGDELTDANIKINENFILSDGKLVRLKDIVSPQDIRDIVRGILTLETEKGRKLANLILEGATNYIPQLKDCEMLEFRAGFVKIMVSDDKEYSLNSASSAHHERKENGIEQKATGYFSNSAMKMTYSIVNASQATELLKENLRFLDKLEKKILQYKKYINEKYIKSIKFIDTVLNVNLRSYFESKVSLTINDLNVSSSPSKRTSSPHEEKIIEKDAQKLNQIFENKTKLNEEIMYLAEKENTERTHLIKEKNLVPSQLKQFFSQKAREITKKLVSANRKKDHDSATEDSLPSKIEKRKVFVGQNDSKNKRHRAASTKTAKALFSLNLRKRNNPGFERKKSSKRLRHQQDLKLNNQNNEIIAETATNTTISSTGQLLQLSLSNSPTHLSEINYSFPKAVSPTPPPILEPFESLPIPSLLNDILQESLDADKQYGENSQPSPYIFFEDPFKDILYANEQNTESSRLIPTPRAVY